MKGNVADDGAAALRVLFLSANPTDTARLAVTEELRAVDARVQASSERHRVALTFAPEARFEDLTTALQRHQPTVVHFSGHGSDAGDLLLADGQGRATAATPHQLGELFAALASELGVRCVVLNACYSEAAAEALLPHVDAVAYVPATLDDRAARAWSAAFYGAVAFGRTLASAHKIACAEAAHVAGERLATPSLRYRDPARGPELRLLPARVHRRPHLAWIAATVAALAAVGVVARVASMGDARPGPQPARDAAVTPDVVADVAQRDVAVDSPQSLADSADVAESAACPAAVDCAPAPVVGRTPRLRCVADSVRADLARAPAGCDADDLHARCRRALGGDGAPRSCVADATVRREEQRRGVMLTWPLVRVGAAALECACACANCRALPIQHVPPQAVVRADAATPPPTPAAVRPDVAPPGATPAAPTQPGIVINQTGANSTVNVHNGPTTIVHPGGPR